jgi:tetratricopeptide (TPR) repeat protein
MKKIKTFYIIVTFYLLTGCVSAAKQTEELLAMPPHDLPKVHEIRDIAFIKQGAAFCGPATLSMAMAWAGEDVAPEALAKEVYTSALGGSFQEDLISSSRRHGLMAIPIKSLDALLREVSANHPVIVLENLSVSWLPRWHYALALGYDLNEQEIIMHSGETPFFRWELQKFERSWMLSEYWGLVVLPAGSLSATGSEEDHIIAVVGLEMAERFEEAEISYKKILERWPTSLISLMGLGNLAYQQGRNNEAVSWLKRAVKAHPESEEARYNLKVAESML